MEGYVVCPFHKTCFNLDQYSNVRIDGLYVNVSWQLFSVAQLARMAFLMEECS